jgi:Ran GTPase-activating protein (RanGAP) involved in mRNA processing and transport
MLGLGAFKAEGATYGKYDNKADNPDNYETDMTGIIALADAIKDMGALLVLWLRSNNLGTKEAGEVLGNMLKGNSVLKELNLSGNRLGYINGGDAPGFAQGISKGLPDNGAMTKFDISSNDIRAEGGKALAEGLKGNQVIKELNFSVNNFGDNCNDDKDTSGIIAIADVIPGMGALSSLDLSGNSLGTEGTTVLSKMLQTVFCEDGKRFKRKGMIAQSTCRHCGHKKSAHVKGALSLLNLTANSIGEARVQKIKEMCGSRNISLLIN